MEQVIAFITENKTISITSAVVIAYIIGLFSNSSIYLSIRKVIGRISFKAGDMVSGFATSKVGKVVWNPLESVLVDFGLFAIERFAAGLRNDNIEKIQEQVERLKDVGSVFQLEVMEGKLDILKNPKDAAMVSKLQENIRKDAANKLKE